MNYISFVTNHESKLLADINQLVRFVIDKAHCVSVWEPDFHQDYLLLNVFRKKISISAINVPSKLESTLNYPM